MTWFRTQIEILTHIRHLLYRVRRLYILELAMLILASFAGCRILDRMQQKAGE